MNQIEPINDYIEPQLKIQECAAKIANLTRKGDFEEAFKVNRQMQVASKKLENWLWKRNNYKA